MPIAIAELRIGFRSLGDDVYVKEWTSTQRRALMKLITDDFFLTLPEVYRLSWTKLQIGSAASTGIEESDIEKVIQTQVDTYNADPTMSYELQISKSATKPLQVGYFWIGGVRFCQHEYALVWRDKGATTEFGDWVVEYTPTGATPYQAEMFAQLTWPSSVV